MKLGYPYPMPSSRKKVRRGDQVIIHKLKWAEHFWNLKKLESPKILNNPENLTIILCHNYDYTPLVEESLKHFGLKYINLGYGSEKDGINVNVTGKIYPIIKYIESGKCKTGLILYLDARDSVILKDLQELVEFYKSLWWCDLFFCSTAAKRGIFRQRKDIYIQNKKTIRRFSRYLNAGGFIGRTNFIYQVFKKIEMLADVYKNEKFLYSDQDLLRYMYPILFPRIEIDHWNQVFFR